METIAMGFILGYFLSAVFIGIGYALGLNIGQKADKETEETSNEELANALDVMQNTGICPSRAEKEYLKAAAERLRREKRND